MAGNQASHAIGPDAFSGLGAASAGELRVYGMSGHWFVEGDGDGDGNADFVLNVDLGAPLPLVLTDFVL